MFVSEVGALALFGILNWALCQLVYAEPFGKFLEDEIEEQSSCAYFWEIDEPIKLDSCKPEFAKCYQSGYDDAFLCEGCSLVDDGGDMQFSEIADVDCTCTCCWFQYLQNYCFKRLCTDNDEFVRLHEYTSSICDRAPVRKNVRPYRPKKSKSFGNPSDKIDIDADDEIDDYYVEVGAQGVPNNELFASDNNTIYRSLENAEKEDLFNMVSNVFDFKSLTLDEDFTTHSEAKKMNRKSENVVKDERLSGVADEFVKSDIGKTWSSWLQELGVEPGIWNLLVKDLINRDDNGDAFKSLTSSKDIVFKHNGPPYNMCYDEVELPTNLPKYSYRQLWKLGECLGLSVVEAFNNDFCVSAPYSCLCRCAILRLERVCLNIYGDTFKPILDTFNTSESRFCNTDDISKSALKGVNAQDKVISSEFNSALGKRSLELDNSMQVEFPRAGDGDGLINSLNAFLESEDENLNEFLQGFNKGNPVEILQTVKKLIGELDYAEIKAEVSLKSPLLITNSYVQTESECKESDEFKELLNPLSEHEFLVSLQCYLKASFIAGFLQKCPTPTHCACKCYVLDSFSGCLKKYGANFLTVSELAKKESEIFCAKAKEKSINSEIKVSPLDFVGSSEAGTLQSRAQIIPDGRDVRKAVSALNMYKDDLSFDLLQDLLDIYSDSADEFFAVCKEFLGEVKFIVFVGAFEEAKQRFGTFSVQNGFQGDPGKLCLEEESVIQSKPLVTIEGEESLQVAGCYFNVLTSAIDKGLCPTALHCSCKCATARGLSLCVQSYRSSQFDTLIESVENDVTRYCFDNLLVIEPESLDANAIAFTGEAERLKNSSPEEKIEKRFNFIKHLQQIALTLDIADELEEIRSELILKSSIELPVAGFDSGMFSSQIVLDKCEVLDTKNYMNFSLDSCHIKDLYYCKNHYKGNKCSQFEEDENKCNSACCLGIQMAECAKSHCQSAKTVKEFEKVANLICTEYAEHHVTEKLPPFPQVEDDCSGSQNNGNDQCDQSDVTSDTKDDSTLLVQTYDNNCRGCGEEPLLNRRAIRFDDDEKYDDDVLNNVGESVCELEEFEPGYDLTKCDKREVKDCIKEGIQYLLDDPERFCPYCVNDNAYDECRCACCFGKYFSKVCYDPNCSILVEKLRYKRYVREICKTRPVKYLFARSQKDAAKMKVKQSDDKITRNATQCSPIEEYKDLDYKRVIAKNHTSKYTSAKLKSVENQFDMFSGFDSEDNTQKNDIYFESRPVNVQKANLDERKRSKLRYNFKLQSHKSKRDVENGPEEYSDYNDEEYDQTHVLYVEENPNKKVRRSHNDSKNRVINVKSFAKAQSFAKPENIGNKHKKKLKNPSFEHVKSQPKLTKTAKDFGIRAEKLKKKKPNKPKKIKSFDSFLVNGPKFLRSPEFKDSDKPQVFTKPRVVETPKQTFESERDFERDSSIYDDDHTLSFDSINEEDDVNSQKFDNHDNQEGYKNKTPFTVNKPIKPQRKIFKTKIPNLAKREAVFEREVFYKRNFDANAIVDDIVEDEFPSGKLEDSIASGYASISKTLRFRTITRTISRLNNEIAAGSLKLKTHEVGMMVIGRGGSSTVELISSSTSESSTKSATESITKSTNELTSEYTSEPKSKSTESKHKFSIPSEPTVTTSDFITETKAIVTDKTSHVTETSTVAKIHISPKETINCIPTSTSASTTSSSSYSSTTPCIITHPISISETTVTSIKTRIRPTTLIETEYDDYSFITITEYDDTLTKTIAKRTLTRFKGTTTDTETVEFISTYTTRKIKTVPNITITEYEESDNTVTSTVTEDLTETTTDYDDFTTKTVTTYAGTVTSTLAKLTKTKYGKSTIITKTETETETDEIVKTKWYPEDTVTEFEDELTVTVTKYYPYTTTDSTTVTTTATSTTTLTSTLIGRARPTPNVVVSLTPRDISEDLVATADETEDTNLTATNSINGNMSQTENKNSTANQLYPQDSRLTSEGTKPNLKFYVAFTAFITISAIALSLYSYSLTSDEDEIVDGDNDTYHVGETHDEVSLVNNE